MSFNTNVLCSILQIGMYVIHFLNLS